MSKEVEIKSSVNELEQKRRLAKEELEEMKSRVKILNSQDLLGQRDEKIRSLQNRIEHLEGQLASSNGEVRSLRVKKATVRTYRVKPGDTLQSISREFYGDP